MPRVFEEQVDALAHCADTRCKGNRQIAVKAVRRTTELSFRDLGGDMSGVERSMVIVDFADHEDAACSVCGKHREVAEQERPHYPGLSGHPQDGLLTIKLEDGTIVREEPDEKMAALEAQVAELSALVAKQATSSPAAKAKAA